MKPLPLVFACSGCGFAGQLAYDLALLLDRHGLAEMTCLAGVAAAKRPFLEKVVDREIWVIDGCTLECASGVLRKAGLGIDADIKLHEAGVPKTHPPAGGLDIDVLVEWALQQTRASRNRIAAPTSASDMEQSPERDAVRSIGDAVIVCDAQGDVRLINPLAETLTGWSDATGVGVAIKELLTIDNENPLPEDPCIQALRDRETVAFPEGSVLIARDRRRIPIEGNITPVRDASGGFEGLVLAFRDVTERRRREDSLRALMKETQHRVKNNFQILSSLLSLQALNLGEQNAGDVLKDCQGRVASMAIVHEMLCRANDLVHIDFAEYVRKLSASMLRAYAPRADVTVSIHAEGILLNVETATPCGLLLQELISNSLKHAFLPDAGGEIRIDLCRRDDGAFALTVADNGIGFSNDLDFRQTDTLGMQLIMALVAQLDGTIERNDSAGTEFHIVFKEQVSGRPAGGGATRA